MTKNHAIKERIMLFGVPWPDKRPKNWDQLTKEIRKPQNPFHQFPPNRPQFEQCNQNQTEL